MGDSIFFTKILDNIKQESVVYTQQSLSPIATIHARRNIASESRGTKLTLLCNYRRGRAKLSPLLTNTTHFFNSPLHSMFFFSVVSSSSPMSGRLCHPHSPHAFPILFKLLFCVSFDNYFSPGLANRRKIIPRFRRMLLDHLFFFTPLNESSPVLEIS